MGKIELDHTGSGSGITLSSDGTDLLLDGTAIGGSALELYAENPSSPTAPSATGTNAVAIGSESVSAGTRTVSLGDSYASGTDSLAAAIANNTSSYGATGANSVAIGYQAKATAFSGFAFGYQNQSTANYAVTVGRNNVGSSQYSLAIGYEATTRATPSIAFAVGSFSGIAGQHQSSIFVLRARTTDATPRVLNTDGGTGGSTNDQIILPNNSAYAFHGTIVARQQASAGTASAAWKVEGLIRSIQARGVPRPSNCPARSHTRTSTSCCTSSASWGPT